MYDYLNSPIRNVVSINPDFNNPTWADLSESERMDALSIDEPTLKIDNRSSEWTLAEMKRAEAWAAIEDIDVWYRFPIDLWRSRDAGVPTTALETVINPIINPDSFDWASSASAARHVRSERESVRTAFEPFRSPCEKERN